MKALVVYDSVYGNTEIVARAIGDAISGDIQVVHVGKVDIADYASVDTHHRLANARSPAD